MKSKKAFEEEEKNGINGCEEFEVHFLEFRT
jgi:hypothetical protein